MTDEKTVWVAMDVGVEHGVVEHVFENYMIAMAWLEKKRARCVGEANRMFRDSGGKYIKVVGPIIESHGQADFYDGDWDAFRITEHKVLRSVGETDD